jgi:hypothetical protein
MYQEMFARPLLDVSMYYLPLTSLSCVTCVALAVIKACMHVLCEFALTVISSWQSAYTPCAFLLVANLSSWAWRMAAWRYCAMLLLKARARLLIRIVRPWRMQDENSTSRYTKKIRSVFFWYCTNNLVCRIWDGMGDLSGIFNRHTYVHMCVNIHTIGIYPHANIKIWVV